MSIITLDFETYYDDSYSLSKLTYEQYVRDPRFEPIMVSIHNSETNELYAVHGETAIAKELESLQLNQHMQVAHNNAFDAFILGDHFNVECGMYGCTMLMARVVHNAQGSMSLANLSKRNRLPPKGDYIHSMKGVRAKDMDVSAWDAYSKYCLGDTENCRDLFNIYRPYFKAQDMNNISETLRWGAICKYELDTQSLAEYMQYLKVSKDEMLSGIAAEYGVDKMGLLKMLRSQRTFAEMLSELGVSPPTKVNDKGDTTYAFAKTDLDFQELGEHPDPRVVALYEARVGTQSSIAESRAQRFYDISLRGKMPFPLIPFKAHSGRAGGTQKINCQNLPKRGGDTALRKAMTAGKDHAVLACDLSQIEARMLAFLAGQEDLLELFAQGVDVYAVFGTGFYGRKIDKSTKTERNVSKEAVLSLGFGAGAKSFADRMKGAYGVEMELDTAKSIVDYYRKTNQSIVSFWSQCTKAIKTMLHGGTYHFGRDGMLTAEEGKIILADGWVLYYEDIKMDGYDEYGREQFSYYSHHHKCRKNLYSGLIANNVTQASAGRIFQWQTYQLRKNGMIMSGAVHDELNAVVHWKNILAYYDAMTLIMRTVPKWAKGVPVDCEFDIGDNYGELYPMEDYISMHYDDLLKYHDESLLRSYIT